MKMLEKILAKEAKVMVEDMAEAVDMAETLNGLKYNVMFANGVRCKDARESCILQTMDLVDSIQLLGLSYHFEKEISESLKRVHDADLNCHGLYETALRFRLLRQQGYRVTPDVFNKFKDEEGNLVSTLKDDPKGLLSLYNAAYLRIHEETILDEAISFTRDQLASMLSDLTPPLATQVRLFLESPLCRRMKRLLARNYISIYQECATRNDALLELAKLDFNLLQCLHRDEIKSISMWDAKAVHQLPEYMKGYFLKLIHTFEEFENLLAPSEKYRLFYLKEALEQTREHVASTVQCYMKEFGTNVHVACEKLQVLIEDAWKDREQSMENVASMVESYMKEYGTSMPVACEKLQNLVENA
ncbi:(S)-beta-bisabolene synthase-like [Musa acuminata AAA Group]|uniref:(S)-beta-bisabolene synthase-like n=1 Tax=Musa acuminata AAA Group TaxID=214697 RepID=UPI0031D20EAD